MITQESIVYSRSARFTLSTHSRISSKLSVSKTQRNFKNNIQAAKPYLNGGRSNAEKLLASLPLSDTLSHPILSQAFIDCVFLFFKYWQGFTNTKDINLSIPKRMEIISQEYKAILKWVHSNQFSYICTISGFDEETTRKQMLNTLYSLDDAKRIADIFNIRIDALKQILPIFLFFYSLIFVQVAFAQTLKPDIPPPALVSRVQVTNYKYTVQNAKTQKITTYTVPSYTYLTTTGVKMDLPVKIRGIKDASGYHPIAAKMKLWGKKIAILQPFLNAAGAVAQIVTAFRL